MHSRLKGIAQAIQQHPFISMFALASTISAVLYGWLFWHGYFFLDEFSWMSHGMMVLENPSSLFTTRMSTFFSPVMNIVYAFMLNIAGTTVWAFTLLGLLIHSSISTLVGICVYKLSHSRTAGYVSVVIAACAGGAFEPLLWIAAQMHSITTLWILLSVYAYIRFLSSQSRVSLFLSFVCFLLALGTKETAIIAPGLIVGVHIFYTRKQWYANISKSLIIFWSSSALISLIYLWLQYTWQSGSVWIEQEVFAFSLRALVRIPYSVVDMIVPLKLFTLSDTANILLGISVCAGIVWTLYRYRTVPLVWLGWWWTLLSMLPTIFFHVTELTVPLSSRFTYLPRIGLIFVCLGIGLYHVQSTKRINIVKMTILGMLLLFCSIQAHYIFKQKNDEYLYVFNTGRTLVTALTELGAYDLQTLYIAPDRPFPSNNADMLAGANIYAGIEKEAVQFLNSDIDLSEQVPRTAYLYWDNKKNTYDVELY